METITLKYDDYLKLVDGYTKSESMKLDLEYLLNSTTYDRYDNDINISSDSCRILFKKYIKDKYDIKIMELKQESERE